MREGAAGACATAIGTADVHTTVVAEPDSAAWKAVVHPAIVRQLWEECLPTG